MPIEFDEPLTEITIDNYVFKATWSAVDEEGCILWVRDTAYMDDFEALGRFSGFDRRKILEFVIRYVTSSQLREDISKKRFERHMEGISPTVFQNIEELSQERRQKAFRELFNLDSVLDEAVDLDWKRRVMAKKFHPDKGGDTTSMSLINEGYEILSDRDGDREKKGGGS